MKSKSIVTLLLCLLTIWPTISQNKVQVIAHRGFWKTDGSAQNSIKALNLADDMGVYGSEFDVHLTADNVAVVHHDDTMLGIPIQSTNYDDIKDMILPNGEKIPTLEKYLNRGRLLKTKLIFELKPHKTPERNREAARICVSIINQLGLQNCTEYITFNLDAGKELIRLSPNTPVFHLNGDLTPQQLKDLGFAGLDYHFNKMKENPQWFKEAKDLGLKINVWTVNDPVIIKEMIDRGADFITTDEPITAQDVISHIGK